MRNRHSHFSKMYRPGVAYHAKKDHVCSLCALPHKPFKVIVDNNIPLIPSAPPASLNVKALKDNSQDFMDMEFLNPYESFKHFQTWCSRCMTYKSECPCKITCLKRCGQCLDHFIVDSRDIVQWCPDCMIPI